MLAAVGAQRAAHAIADQARNCSWWRNIISPATVLTVLLTVYTIVNGITVFQHLRDLRDLAPIREARKQAAAFIVQKHPHAPIMLASDDIFVPFEANAWYLPIWKDAGDDIVVRARSYGAQFVTVEGFADSPWRNGADGMQQLLTRSNVPEGLAFMCEFGDPSQHHVVAYRVLPDAGDDAGSAEQRSADITNTPHLAP